jgi:hypothetical protein
MPAPAIAAAQLYILQVGQFRLYNIIAWESLDAVNEIQVSGNFDQLSPPDFAGVSFGSEYGRCICGYCGVAEGLGIGKPTSQKPREFGSKPQAHFALPYTDEQ